MSRKIWECLCVCVCEHEQVPMEVTARSQKRELHPSGSLQSALSAVSSRCYGSSSEGCIHGQRRKLASPTNRPPAPSSLPVSPRLAPDPLVNLPRGRRSMAQSCRVTVRDDEGENENERSYTTQMGMRDEKMKRWDQIWLVSRGGVGGVAIPHFRKWLLFLPSVFEMELEYKWRWIFLLWNIQHLFIVGFSY